jgi:hypothetical protein
MSKLAGPNSVLLTRNPTGGLLNQRILLAAGLTLLTTQPPMVAAQQPAQFGGQLSFANNANLGIGARMVSDFASLVPSARNVSLLATFDYFFPGNNVAYWELNGNAVYRATISGARILPYVGGGLDIAHAGSPFSGFGPSGTRLGLNLVGGTWFRTASNLRPFLELRFEISGGQQFVLAAGLLF